jgi:hypothetical protein
MHHSDTIWHQSHSTLQNTNIKFHWNIFYSFDVSHEDRQSARFMHYTKIVYILCTENLNAFYSCDLDFFIDVYCLLQLRNIMLRLCLLVLAVLRNITLSSISSNTAVTVAVANRTKMGVTWARDTLLNSISGTVIIRWTFLLYNMSRIPLRRILWSLKIKFENWVSIFIETAEYFQNYFHYYTLHAAYCRHIWDGTGPHYIGLDISSNVILTQLGKALLHKHHCTFKWLI